MTFTCRVASIGLLSLGFIVAGLLHFLHPDAYARLVPPAFPAARLLVLVSGIAEIAGGAGLLVPRLRRVAAWGLIALLIAVFPANVYMAMHPERFEDMRLPAWAFWARLPLQGVLIAWVAWVRGDRPSRNSQSSHFRFRGRLR